MCHRVKPRAHYFAIHRNSSIHLQHAASGLTAAHGLQRFVDLLQRKPVRDQRVKLQLARVVQPHVLLEFAVQPREGVVEGLGVARGDRRLGSDPIGQVAEE